MLVGRGATSTAGMLDAWIAGTVVTLRLAIPWQGEIALRS
jgi:hypothetical protein